MSFDFSWGEPFCVREALKQYYKNRGFFFDIDQGKYSPNMGDEKLIELTKQFLRETTGIDYKYVIITHGTTGAINVVLRVLSRLENKKICYTHEYYFPYYPQIIEKNNYTHLKGLYKGHQRELAQKGAVGIVDSPSNPLGDLLLYTDANNNIIWDSVYHNPVFINSIPVKPDHRVNCGAYSKVLGLTGLRVGWIATNNEDDYNNFLLENLYENCTMSFANQSLAKDILNNIDLDNFMRAAKYRVNNNREMFERIAYLFDKQPVPESGMFFSAWTTPKTQDILEKLEIKTVELDTDGKDKLLRFNLAQTNEVTNKAIRFLLKEDKI